MAGELHGMDDGTLDWTSGGPFHGDLMSVKYYPYALEEAQVYMEHTGIPWSARDHIPDLNVVFAEPDATNGAAGRVTIPMNLRTDTLDVIKAQLAQLLLLEPADDFVIHRWEDNVDHVDMTAATVHLRVEYPKSQTAQLPAFGFHDHIDNPNKLPSWPHFQSHFNLELDVDYAPAETDPCADPASSRSSDPCCGVETWQLIAVPLPTNSKHRFVCTGLPNNQLFVGYEYGRNITFYTDATCTTKMNQQLTPHDASNPQSTPLVVAPVFGRPDDAPGSCADVAGWPGGMKFFTVVPNGRISDVSRILNNKENAATSRLEGIDEAECVSRYVTFA
jgi:hypothetical protein